MTRSLAMRGSARLKLAMAVAALAGLAADAVRAAITYEMVTVGDAGNAADITTYGAVAHEYQIGKYAVTIGQYAEFLNAVAATDTYSLYNVSMSFNLNIAGISRSGASGSYSYSVITNGGDSSNRPITFVTWFDSARFANWMANGQPTGAQGPATTEDGAYNVNGATSGNAPAKNATNPNTGAAPTFYIPTENEWYKAAYYSPVKGGDGVPGYYQYATQSDNAPGNLIGNLPNQANYNTGAGFSVTQSPSVSPSQNYLTDVGAFTNSESFYGTFDQSGNVYQWNDLDGSPSSFRGLRGGYWSNTFSGSIGFSERVADNPAVNTSSVGFRLASPVAVPEPSMWIMGLTGIAGAGWAAMRRCQASIL